MRAGMCVRGRVCAGARLSASMRASLYLFIRLFVDGLTAKAFQSNQMSNVNNR